jgi:hypothetical protein
MEHNFWIYSSSEEQRRCAQALKVFGKEIIKKAKVIREFDLLKELTLGLDSKSISPQNSLISDFAFEYLIDCVRILIFFENYMKAELIVQDFCIHRINKQYPTFSNLAKDQFIRPIKLKEIHNIEPFIINCNNKFIHHNALLDTTIGMKELIKKEDYLSCYELPPSLISFVESLNKERNRLHFNEEIEFQLSKEFINNLETINNFVDRVI